MASVRSALLFMSLAVTASFPAAADVLLIDSIQSAPSVRTPAAGTPMDAVRTSFGSPSVEHPTVSSGGGPLQPPITRWDYDRFSVFFERDRVIHAVVHRPGAR